MAMLRVLFCNFVAANRAAPHEATFLGLAIDKAWRDLAWQPRWDFDQTVKETAEWYRREG